MTKSISSVEKETKDNNQNTEEVFDNIKYICDSTSLIVESLRRGLDIAQLPSGDIIVTEVKTVNTLYSWDDSKSKLVKISQN